MTKGGAHIKRISLYYFSGTGNAKNTAVWIKNYTEQNNIRTSIIDISKLEKRKHPDIPENETIGFCSPTHGFNFPPIMFHFILNFPRSKNNSVFIVNTRAGMKLGKIFLPGLSGIAQFFSAFILLLKGYKIIGMFPLDLPSNWISVHPGLKKKVVESIYEKRKKQTQVFTEKLIRGKKVYSALKDLIQDLIISPVSVGYYFAGRFFFAKSFVASKDCDHCNLCIKQCPVQAIKLVQNHPYWTLRCESCMRCMNNCPKRAIETAHGFIAGVFILFDTVVLYLLYKYIPLKELIGRTFLNGFAGIFILIINSLVFLICLFVSYRIMHFLLRYTFFERIIVYTSLTKYKFWRRYKSPKF